MILAKQIFALHYAVRNMYYVGMYDENKWVLVMLWNPLYRTCGSKNKFSDNDIFKFLIKFRLSLFH